jgi:hypothetical protein
MKARILPDKQSVSLDKPSMEPSLISRDHYNFPGRQFLSSVTFAGDLDMFKGGVEGSLKLV